MKQIMELCEPVFADINDPLLPTYIQMVAQLFGPKNFPEWDMFSGMNIILGLMQTNIIEKVSL